MKALFQRIHLLWAIMTHKEAPLRVKIFLILGLFYIIFPADLLPDQILLAGWLDDLILGIIMFFMAMKFTPEDLVRQLWHTIHREKNNNADN